MFSWGNSKNFTLSRLKKQKLNNPVQCISCNSVNTSYKTQTATPKRSKGAFLLNSFFRQFFFQTPKHNNNHCSKVLSYITS